MFGLNPTRFSLRNKNFSTRNITHVFEPSVSTYQLSFVSMISGQEIIIKNQLPLII